MRSVIAKSQKDNGIFPQLVRTSGIAMSSDLNTTPVLDEGIESLLLPLDDGLYYSTEEEEEDLWPAYLSWIQKIFATLSILSSYVICRELLADLRVQDHRPRSSRRDNSQHTHAAPRGTYPSRRPLQRSIGRILLNLSIADIIFSVAIFLGEWPAPRDTPYIHSAAGNRSSCTFQGWMRALGYLSSPMFSVALNAFYLLLARYRWRDAELAGLERKATIGIWLYALALSIVPIPLGAYNSDWDVCWIVPAPLDCLGDECTRGVIANDLEIYYSFVHIWTCIGLCVLLMLGLFWTVRNVEDRTWRYTTTATATNPVLVNQRSTTTGGGGSSLSVVSGKPSSTPGREEQSVLPSTASSAEDHPMVKEEEEEPETAGEEKPVTRKTRVSFFVENTIDDADSETPNEESSTETPAAEGSATGRPAISSTEDRFLSRATSSFLRRTPSASAASWTTRGRAHQKSRAVAYQGVLYTLAFLSTHLLDCIASIVWRMHGFWRLYFDIVAYMVLQPSLGVFNFLIFCRNRKSMATPEGRFLRNVFSCCGFWKACGCGQHRNTRGQSSASSTLTPPAGESPAVDRTPVTP